MFDLRSQEGVAQAAAGPTRRFDFIKQFCNLTRSHTMLDCVSPLKCEKAAKAQFDVDEIGSHSVGAAQIRVNPPFSSVIYSQCFPMWCLTGWVLHLVIDSPHTKEQHERNEDCLHRSTISRPNTWFFLEGGHGTGSSRHRAFAFQHHPAP